LPQLYTKWCYCIAPTTCHSFLHLNTNPYRYKCYYFTAILTCCSNIQGETTVTSQNVATWFLLTAHLKQHLCVHSGNLVVAPHIKWTVKLSLNLTRINGLMLGVVDLMNMPLSHWVL
jgi:hypothetical protein